MEKEKTNKIKITVNGQSFEVPVDMSVLQGFMQSMPNPVPKQVMTRQSFGLPMIQSSHRRLEDDFFRLFHEDMNTFRRFGMFNRDERMSRAIVVLHNRLRRIEEYCCPIEEPVKEVVKKAKPTKKSVKKPAKKSQKK